MRRSEAIKLIGQRVRAWTASNGVYVGNLIEVTNDRPWRARVLITGVLSAPCLFEFGKIPKSGYLRKGLRPGDVIEVGGVNCQPTDKEGITYLEALKNEQAKFEQFASNYKARNEDVPAWIMLTLPCIAAAIKDESSTEIPLT